VNTIWGEIDMRCRLAIVEEDIKYVEALKIVLEEKIYELTHYRYLDELLKKGVDADICLVNLDEKNFTIDMFEKLKEVNNNKHSHIIGLSSKHDIEKIMIARKNGMDYYHLKSHPTEELISLIENQTRKETTEELEGILLKSNNEKFKKSVEIAAKAAKSDVNILILGESGVGKEVFAKYIHYCSERSKEIFVPVNCHSYSESLLESELFGHEKGAFTGAINSRSGKFEEASRGTLFLDEVGDIPIDIQVKLLRTIENKTVEKIGSNVTKKVDFRLISATNKNLQADIFNGSFREDFFYRISTIVIEIPPIRERREDLKMLIEFFMEQISKQFGKEIYYIEKEVENFLYSYDYPGNVRELKNILDRLIVLSENGIIATENLPICFGYKKKENYACSTELEIMPLREIRKEFEKEYIRQVLEYYGGNQTQAAKILEISRRQLVNKIEEYGLRKK
jgi:DNA-binding NtrC family response regulator